MSTNNTYQFANVWNPTRNYTSDGLNRLTSSAGAALSYDGRGNLNLDQNGTSYGYDPLNNLVSTSNGIGLGYDPLGRLQVIGVNGVNTQFIYDGDQMIAELDGSFNPLRWYVDGPGEDQPMVWYEGWNTGDRRFLLADERGSIVSVTNGSGQVMATNTYDEYGLPGSGNLGRFQYTGQAWIPELGLYHYKARAYSPSLGRFMQTDPTGYGDGLNLYAYVHNDPINGIDPTGLEGDPATVTCKPDGTDCESSEIVVTSHHPDPFSVIISTIFNLPKFVAITLPQNNQQPKKGCANQPGAPLYDTYNFGFQIPIYPGLQIGPHFTVDSYGQVYAGIGGGAGLPGAEATVQDVPQLAAPSARQLASIISSWGVQAEAGFIAGIAGSFNQSGATVGGGLGVGLGFDVGYTWKVGQIGKPPC